MNHVFFVSYLDEFFSLWTLWNHLIQLLVSCVLQSVLNHRKNLVSTWFNDWTISKKSQKIKPVTIRTDKFYEKKSYIKDLYNQLIWLNWFILFYIYCQSVDKIWNSLKLTLKSVPKLNNQEAIFKQLTLKQIYGYYFNNSSRL